MKNRLVQHDNWATGEKNDKYKSGQMDSMIVIFRFAKDKQDGAE